LFFALGWVQNADCASLKSAHAIGSVDWRPEIVAVAKFQQQADPKIRVQEGLKIISADWVRQRSSPIISSLLHVACESVAYLPWFSLKLLGWPESEKVPNPYTQSAALSKIIVVIIPPNLTDSSVILNHECGNLGFFIKGEIRQLITLHGLQLALHYGDLALHDRDLFANSLISGAEGSPLSNADDDGDRGEKSDNPSGISGSSSGAILGALMFFAGAALLKFALYLGDAPQNPFTIRVFAWGVGVIAAVLSIQGGLLFLIGEGLF
jgi:hypothetical protein